MVTGLVCGHSAVSEAGAFVVAAELDVLAGCMLVSEAGLVPGGLRWRRAVAQRESEEEPLLHAAEVVVVET